GELLARADDRRAAHEQVLEDRRARVEARARRDDHAVDLREIDAGKVLRDLQLGLRRGHDVAQLLADEPRRDIDRRDDPAELALVQVGDDLDAQRAQTDMEDLQHGAKRIAIELGHGQIETSARAVSALLAVLDPLLVETLQVDAVDAVNGLLDRFHVIASNMADGVGEALELGGAELALLQELD